MIRLPLCFIPGNTKYNHSTKWNLEQCSCSTHTQKKVVKMVYTDNRILFGLKREGKPVICYNMDESWGHNGNWNNPVT